MFSWIGAIFIGAFCGWIASKITKNDAEMGGLANIIVGIIGGSVGRLVLGFFNLEQKDGIVPAVIVGILGSVIVLSIYNFIRGKR